MKKLIENNGVTYFEYRNENNEGYWAKVLVVEDNMTDLILYKPNGEEVTSGAVYDDKHPNGLPVTTYWKRKLKMEIDSIICEMLDIRDAILNGDESVIDEILQEE